MNNDRELLELAARAAKNSGMDIEFEKENGIAFDENAIEWNPLVDDGDALKLATMLEIRLDWGKFDVVAIQYEFDIVARETKNGAEATRRAITRAAAEIGKAMAAYQNQKD